MPFQDDKRRMGMARIKQATVPNPIHAAKLHCPNCGRPYMQRPGKELCFECYWAEVKKRIANWEAELDRGEIEDNRPAQQHPEGY